jgi:hypothetical protein
MTAISEMLISDLSTGDDRRVLDSHVIPGSKVSLCTNEMRFFALLNILS